jgi:hypothetical protein
MSRMAVSWDTPGNEPLTGRLRGQRGSMTGMHYEGDEKKLPDLEKPPLPPSVAAGHHGGSSGHLMNEFVMAILEDRKPLVDIAMALNMTVAGIVAHQSALKGGELMKMRQYKWPRHERLLVGRAEPLGELPQVADDGLAAGGGKVVVVQEAGKAGCLVLADRDALEKTIRRVFHGLSPRIGHESDAFGS